MVVAYRLVNVHNHVSRVGHNRIYDLFAYMTTYLMKSLQKIPCIHRVQLGLARTVYLHRI